MSAEGDDGTRRFIEIVHTDFDVELLRVPRVGPHRWNPRVWTSSSDEWTERPGAATPSAERVRSYIPAAVLDRVPQIIE
jgi:hypothetical protein